MADEKLQEIIDEIDNLDSDRPSFEVNVNTKSSRPKIPDGPIAKAIAVVMALGAMAEVVHQLLK
jgi:hypothetical protein